MDYFREIFASSNPENIDTLFEKFPPRITGEMNDLLTARISDEEIKRAAFAIKSSSGPGSDGLTGSFYQQFWCIVGPDIIKEIKEFFSTSVFLVEWNYTHLCLITKVRNTMQMSELRLISLCSVHYKIISKILCARLKAILTDIISDTQGAFVSERLISFNILIAHEMIHALRTNSEASSEFMAIKTDMSKAYD